MSAVSPVTRLYREARRRKVFRTAALYVVGAWLAFQVAALMSPGFGIPDSAIRALIWAAALGLPVAAIFGWLFEIGPGGIRRTAPLGAGRAVEPRALGRQRLPDSWSLRGDCGRARLPCRADIRETPGVRTTDDAIAAACDAARLPNFDTRCCPSPTSATTPTTSISATESPRRSSTACRGRPRLECDRAGPRRLPSRAGTRG